jgi:hypothetical protein
MFRIMRALSLNSKSVVSSESSCGSVWEAQAQAEDGFALLCFALRGGVESTFGVIHVYLHNVQPPPGQGNVGMDT